MADKGCKGVKQASREYRFLLENLTTLPSPTLDLAPLAPSPDAITLACIPIVFEPLQS